jgi:hypothetical protein
MAVGSLARTGDGICARHCLLLAVLCQNPAVAELDELKIPKAVRPVAEEVITITDEVCAELLDAEYAALARQVVAKLARNARMLVTYVLLYMTNIGFGVAGERDADRH